MSDDRKIADRSNRLDGGQHFAQIREGLQDEKVHASFRQRLGLERKTLDGFLPGDVSEGFDGAPDGADGPRHVNSVARHLPGDFRPRPVDFLQLTFQTMRAELESVGAIGVCLNDIRADFNVVPVNLFDQIGRRQVQAFETAVDINALGVQQGPGRAIADQDVMFDSFSEILGQRSLFS